MKNLRLLFVCIVVTGFVIFGAVNVFNFMDSKSESMETKAAQVNEKVDIVNREDDNVKKAIRKVNNSLSIMMDSYKEEQATSFVEANRSQLIKDQKLIADQTYNIHNEKIRKDIQNVVGLYSIFIYEAPDGEKLSDAQGILQDIEDIMNGHTQQKGKSGYSHFAEGKHSKDVDYAANAFYGESQSN
ncbi:hypothetical protein [Priestia sp. FSL R5-0680]|uniref:hypothetical protein n=1 Tax=Priestia sp. FSL R5-0680 TaxID=2921582 RepID=UPI0030F7A8B6